MAATIDAAPAMIELGVTDIGVLLNAFVASEDDVAGFFAAAARAIAASGWVRHPT